MKKIAILFNPSSGKGRSLKLREKIENHLGKYHINFDLTVTESENHLRQLAAEITLAYDTIIGVGGDTTFNIIAGEILKKDDREHSPTLGMIGTGSANDITRGLGINNIEDACAAINKSSVKKMDVGIVRIIKSDSRPSGSQSPPRFFLGTLSLGLGTTVNRYIEKFHERHRLFSRLNPFDQLFTGFFAVRDSFSKKKVPFTIDLTDYDIITDETTMRPTTFSLLVFLNTPYYANGMKLGEDNGLFDGLLDCRVVHTRSFSHTIRTGIRIGRGTQKPGDVTAIRSNLFRLSAEQAFDIQVDGEIIESVNDVEISLVPGALNVLAPCS
jgi:diacylglycerol kinase family enzyme